MKHHCPMCGEQWNEDACSSCGWFEGKQPRYTELDAICARPGCIASYARGQSYRQLPPYCSHACQRLAARVPVPDRTWFCRRLRNCDLAAEGFTKTDLEMLLLRYRRTGYVTPAQAEYVPSPANHVGHRRIRDEQLRLIAAALEQSRPVLWKVV